ncbi:MAG: peroxiredoxin [Rhodospirillales bacterium]|nr:peroxiredoxin [Rhodospirillales bacterium]MDE0382076.1 peroxiredoxin [Rhodospirillales bacterium]
MRVPEVTFKTRVRDESVEGSNPFRWQDRTSAEIFDGRRVVLFALPGAFTPTCSTTHLPGYEALHDTFTAYGIDEVVCLSVNDAFVMYQWGRHQGVDQVTLLPDGCGTFTRLMGMLVDKDNLGFGQRSWRYSMLVEDGEITRMFVEPGRCDNAPGDPFEVSDAQTMLDYVESLDRVQAA